MSRCVAHRRLQPAQSIVKFDAKDTPLTRNQSLRSVPRKAKGLKQASPGQARHERRPGLSGNQGGKTQRGVTTRTVDLNSALQVHGSFRCAVGCRQILAKLKG